MKIIFLLIIVFNSTYAQDLPSIYSPAILKEGTERKLNKEQIEKILPWAKDSKIFLQDLLNETQIMPFRFRIDRLQDGIKNVVLNSAANEGELLLRYVLNRGVAILEVIEDETNPDAIGITDLKLRILEQTISLALKYFKFDLEYLNAEDQEKFIIPFAEFGVRYSLFLMELNKSTIDASAQYELALAALEFLQWDLYRDFANKQYASIIYKINSALKTYPRDGQRTDEEYLVYIRSIKKLFRDLKLNELRIIPRPVPAKPIVDVPIKPRVISTPNDDYNPKPIINEDPTITGYRAMLTVTNWTARIKAIEHISQIPGEEVTKLLIERLNDSDADVRNKAALEVSKREISENNCSDMLRLYKSNKNWTGRLKIVKVAEASLHPTCRKLLFSSLNDADADVSVSAYNFIKSSNGPINAVEVEILCNSGLYSTSWVNRSRSAELISLAGPGDEVKKQAYACLLTRFPNERDSDVVGVITRSMNKLK